MTLTRITSDGITDGTIANADLNASAAIAGSKVSPDFGSQNIATTGTLGSSDITITSNQPKLSLEDSSNNPDWSVKNANGNFAINDETNSATRFSINSSNGVEFHMHAVPSADSTYDLGLTGTRWRNVYADTLYGDGSNLTGINTDLVSDTSPQLGGDLASNGNNINMADDDIINVGSSNDLRIRHNGTNSLIEDMGTGNLQIRGDDVHITGTNDELMAKFVENGAVELYHNNSKKFETNTYGALLSGSLFTTAHVYFGNQTSDNCKAFFGASNDLEIYHDGTASYIKNNNGDLILRDDAIQLQAFSTTDTYLYAVNGGRVELRYDNSKKFETASYGTATTGDAYISGDLLLTTDTGKILLGGGNDLQIYHNGSHSYLSSETGNLNIGANNEINILGGTDFAEYMARFIDNGAVELYHNGTKKFETTSTGINVTGKATFPDGNSNGVFIGNSEDLRIFHNGSHSYVENVTGNLNLTSSSSVVLKTNNTEDAVVCNANGSVDLYHNNSKKLETRSDGVDIHGLVEVNGDVRPNLNGTHDLGTSSLRWANVYTNDLNLSNEGGANDVDGTWGSYTIQEGAEDLFLVNKRNGKKYKFNLTEVS